MEPVCRLRCILTAKILEGRAKDLYFSTVFALKCIQSSGIAMVCDNTEF